MSSDESDLSNIPFPGGNQPLGEVLSPSVGEEATSLLSEDHASSGEFGPSGADEDEEFDDADEEDDLGEGEDGGDEAPKSSEVRKEQQSQPRAQVKSFGDDGGEEEDADEGQLQADRPHFPLVGRDYLSRMWKVWVEPPGFEALTLPEPDAGSRVVVLQGPDHSGKLTAAVNLCCILAGGRYPDGCIYTYRRRAIEPHSLLEVVESSHWPPDGAFVIIRDAFDKSISLGELDGPELDQLIGILKRKKSFLLLTTEVEPNRVAALSARKLMLSQFGHQDLRTILEKHLDFYHSTGGLTPEVEEKVRQSWERIAGTLRTPDLVNQLCRRVIEEQVRDREAIVALADEIGKLAIVDLRAWFDKLPLDAQLFVMMAYLFEGLDLASLESLYLEAVARLHREGATWMRDSRRLCLLYLQEALGPDGVADESVELADAAVRRQVAWQVGNRRLLLSSILSPVIAEAAQHALWRDAAARRAILGVALGKLGIHDPGMFASSLDLLARSRSTLPAVTRNSFAAIPGYAMTESLRRDPTAEGGIVLSTLKRWVTAGHPDFLWTAGAAIWRVYQVAKTLEGRGGSGTRKPEPVERLRHYLKEMVLAYGNLNKEVLQRLKKDAAAGRSDRKEAARAYRAKLYEISREGMNCASFAIERIGRVDVPAMVALSLDWIRQSDEKLRDVAFRAARLTFQNLAKMAQPPSFERYGCILDLFRELIVKAQPVALVTKAAFGLAEWLSSADWREALVGTLLDLSRSGTRQDRRRLREALARYWSESPLPEARAVARALIARSYAMDGVLTQSPSLGRGLLIVDPDLVYGQGSRRVEDPEGRRQAERREGTLRQILAMVEAVMAEREMDLTVLLLGAQESAVREGGTLRLSTDLPLHRLMKPGIQNLSPEHLRMVLLLAAGPVIDLEDALDSLSADHKLVIAAGCDLEVPLGTELLCLKRDLPPGDLDAIEKKLRSLCARAQASLDPAAWEPLLERLGVDLVALDANPEGTLAAWAAQLGEIPFPDGHDPAKKILCALLRLAPADLDTCLQIVRAWLMEGKDLERPMAAAVAVALVRTVTDAPGIWGGLAPQSIFDELAGALAASGNAGTDFLLETVERWLAEPVLAEILAGDIEDGRCRLLRWAEKAAPQQLAAFQKALEPLRRSLEEVELGPSGEILDAAFDRLRVRLAMGRPRPLPPLAAGETYAVIVFDAAARWGPLAAKLFKRFNQPEESRKPLLYRLGERWPSWVAGDPNPDSSDLSSVGVRLPRLLGPILRELSPASVSFLVVLAGEMWIDAEDWLSSPWRARIITHRQLADGHLGAEWVALPRLPGQEKDEVDLMATYLKQQLTEDPRVVL